MEIKRLLLVAICSAFSAFVQAQGTDRGYFTAVVFSDPHISQDGCTSVATMQNYVNNIVKMGKVDGALFSFNKAPKGFVPRADIVFCLGDMDADSEKQGTDFKNAVQGFNDAGIPFIVIAGNHDLVPDYWNGGDYGLTYAGAQSNSCALGIVTSQYEAAQKLGIKNYQRINDGSGHVQTDPMTFTFNGVRFYVAQTYWFQKPYTFPSLLGKGKMYAPDGVISKLESVVNEHKDEPSVWMQHYPFVAGSDNDRWWSDANSSGQVVTPQDATEYDTPTKKKNKLASLIAQTNNPYHFSGHYHYFHNDTYTSTENSKIKVKDYVVAAPFEDKCGCAYLVLMKENVGVVEIKQVFFSDANMPTDKVEDLTTDAYYQIYNGDAGLVLTLTPNKQEDGAVLHEFDEKAWLGSCSDVDGQYFRLEPATTKGQYYLRTANGRYMGFNTYSITSYKTTADDNCLVTFEAAGGGNRYIIHSLANGTSSNTLGLDNLVDGSPAYADKTSTNHNVWYLLKNETPVFDESQQEKVSNSSNKAKCYYLYSIPYGTYAYRFEQSSSTNNGALRLGKLKADNDNYLFYFKYVTQNQYNLLNLATGEPVCVVNKFLNALGEGEPALFKLVKNESGSGFVLNIVNEGYCDIVSNYVKQTDTDKQLAWKVIYEGDHEMPQPMEVNDNKMIFNDIEQVRYNLAGQRVGKDYRGIVISGGKLKIE